MGRVRGIALVEARDFFRDRYGAEAHARVLTALDPETRRLLEAPLREVGWYPLAVLVAYLATAKRVLDPGAVEFFRAQGFDAALRRRRGPLSSMVSTSQLRMRLARVVWRMFYDVGRLEVVSDRPEGATTRIHGFPATPELCERFLGIWEGIASRPGVRPRAEELRCVLRGDPYCELRVFYDAPDPP